MAGRCYAVWLPHKGTPVNRGRSVSDGIRLILLDARRAFRLFGAACVLAMRHGVMRQFDV